MTLVLSCAGGCAQSTSSQFHASALASGLQAERLSAAGFELQIYRNDAVGEHLHIYFSGDGSPWIEDRYVARDPTPRRSVVLPLLLEDPQPSVYVGRPCYHRSDSAESSRFTASCL